MAIIKPNNNTISAITALPAAITTGKVLQVVSYSNTYLHGTTGTSATDVLSASATTWEPAITPTVSTSKILVLASIHIYNADNSAATSQEQRYFLDCDVKVGSGSYNGFLNQSYLGQYYYPGASRPDPMNQSTYATSSKQYDHNTTDEIKFRWQFGLHASGVLVQLHGDSKASTVTLMEIA